MASLLVSAKWKVNALDEDITSNPNFDAKQLTFLSPSKHQTLLAKLRRDGDSAYIEAKRAMSSTTAKIPLWFIGLTVALGWNELIAVLRSPLFFLTLAFLGGGNTDLQLKMFS